MAAKMIAFDEDARRALERGMNATAGTAIGARSARGGYGGGPGGHPPGLTPVCTLSMRVLNMALALSYESDSVRRDRAIGPVLAGRK